MTDAEVIEYEKMRTTRALVAQRWLTQALAIKTMACKDAPLTIERDESLESDWDLPVLRVNNFMMTTRTKHDETGFAHVPELCEIWRLREFDDRDTGYRGLEVVDKEPTLKHFSTCEAIAAMIGLALGDYTNDALFAAEEAVIPDPEPKEFKL